MKKIVWVFGESATGKKTLIDKLSNHDEEVLNTFNMNNKKIVTSEITLKDNSSYIDVIDNNFYDDSLMDEDNLYFSREKAKRRRSYILHDVDKFINGNSDILLIKGQINDLRINRGNTINYFLKKYSDMKDLQIEVILLKVDDENELKRRLENKSWFKRIEDENEKVRLRKDLLLKQKAHIEEVINTFSDYNVPITIYESLDNSYQYDGIINEKRIKTRNI